MTGLDWTLFGGECNEWNVDRAAGELRGLAPYWLSDDALDLRSDVSGNPMPRSRPELPIERGSCWPIFVNQSPETYCLLRKSMPLPLRWAEHQNHDDRLPDSLLELAERVKADLTPEFPEVGRNVWGLHHAVPHPPDLGSIKSIQPNSAWVSLAAGLVIAVKGGRPDPGVWASGAWTSRGWIDRVGDVEEKVAVAADFGARMVFVPEQNRYDGLVAADKYLRRRYPGDDGPHKLVVRALPANEPKVGRAIGPYLARLLAVLPPDASRQDLADRYELLYSLDKDSARESYDAQIVPEIVRYLRENGDEKVPRVTHLVTIASGSPDLVATMISVLCPDAVLILHTQDSHGHELVKSVEKLLDRLQAMEQRSPSASRTSLRVKKSFVMDDTLRGMLAAHVAEFTRDVRAEDVGFDMTPGPYLPKQTVTESCVRGGNRLYFVTHDQHLTHRFVIPFSQRIVTWKSGEIWTLPKKASPSEQ
jgi:hypothetical protein